MKSNNRISFSGSVASKEEEKLKSLFDQKFNEVMEDIDSRYPFLNKVPAYNSKIETTQDNPVKE